MHQDIPNSLRLTRPYRRAGPSASARHEFLKGLSLLSVPCRWQLPPCAEQQLTGPLRRYPMRLSKSRNLGKYRIAAPRGRMVEDLAAGQHPETDPRKSARHGDVNFIRRPAALTPNPTRPKSCRAFSSGIAKNSPCSGSAAGSVSPRPCEPFPDPNSGFCAGADSVFV